LDRDIHLTILGVRRYLFTSICIHNHQRQSTSIYIHLHPIKLGEHLSTSIHIYLQVWWIHPDPIFLHPWLRVLKDFIPWIRAKHKLDVDVIRADNELGRKRTTSWLRSHGITFEPSAPNTQAQNGVAERSGGVIVEKACAMRISANLPHDLSLMTCGMRSSTAPSTSEIERHEKATGGSHRTRSSTPIYLEEQQSPSWRT
jgi:hypothetical protein